MLNQQHASMSVYVVELCRTTRAGFCIMKSDLSTFGARKTNLDSKVIMQVNAGAFRQWSVPYFRSSTYHGSRTWGPRDDGFRNGFLGRSRRTSSQQLSREDVSG